VNSDKTTQPTAKVTREKGAAVIRLTSTRWCRESSLDTYHDRITFGARYDLAADGGDVELASGGEGIPRVLGVNVKIAQYGMLPCKEMRKTQVQIGGGNMSVARLTGRGLVKGEEVVRGRWKKRILTDGRGRGCPQG